MSDPALVALAQRLLASVYAGFGPFELVEVDFEGFEHLDLGAYAKRSVWFESRHFTHLGQLELPALARSPHSLLQRTCMSVHASAHGSIVGMYYQVRCHPERLRANLIQGLKNMRLVSAPMNFLGNLGTRHIFDFSTRLDDGTEMLTASAMASAKLQSPPEVDALRLPTRSSPDTVLKTHIDRVKAALAAHPERRVLPVTTLPGVIEACRQTHERKVAYRESIGWLTRDELIAFGTKPQMIDALHAEVQRQVGPITDDDDDASDDAMPETATAIA